MKEKITHSEQLEKRELFDGAVAVFTHSKNMTLAEWKFEPDTPLPVHSHPHEQMTKIISGEFELTISDKKHLLKEGSVAVIPPNAVHSGRAVTKCRIVDVFNPVREDLR